MATLEIIAKKTGVSTSAVSLALFKRGIDSQTGHRRISVGTENRIRAVARELNYMPNIMARGMKKKQTFIIALIVNSISTSFYSSIIEGLTNTIEAKDYHLLICHSNQSHEREQKHLSNLQRKQIDGVVIAPVLRKGKSSLKEGIENFRGKPVLLLGYNPIDHPFAITFDDVTGCMDAVRHLHQQRHTNIGFVPASLEQPHSLDEVTGWLPVKRRLQGYQQAMQEAALRGQIVLDEDSLIAGIRSRDLTALITSTDEVAASLYPLLKEKGLRIPDDLSIISLGDTPLAPLLDPPLTAICLPKVELGVKAGNMMLQAIEKKQISRETMPMELIMRKSCITLHG